MAVLTPADPKILTFDRPTCVYTEDVMDFWRSNHRKTALFNGKYSIDAHLRALSYAWGHYQEGGHPFSDMVAVCYHQPFTKMANKAHCKLSKMNFADADGDRLADLLDPTQIYNRRIGNTYAASMYFALISLLENVETSLAGARIGFFIYGSGSVGDFWSGAVKEGYLYCVSPERSVRKLDQRTALSHAEYLRFHSFGLPENGSSVVLEDKTSTNGYRLIGLEADRRQYERLG